MDFVRGDLSPTPLRQLEPQSCGSACILSLVDRKRFPDVTERHISDDLEAAKLLMGGGLSLFEADQINRVLEPLGLHAEDMFVTMDWGDGPDLDERDRNIDAVIEALTDGAVMLAYPRQREGQNPFQHYSTVTGMQRRNGNEDTFVLMDPSEIDGDVRKLIREEFEKIMTPLMTDEGPIVVGSWKITRI
jgi:hypothetical protein